MLSVMSARLLDVDGTVVVGGKSSKVVGKVGTSPHGFLPVVGLLGFFLAAALPFFFNTSFGAGGFLPLPLTFFGVLFVHC